MDHEPYWVATTHLHCRSPRVPYNLTGLMNLMNQVATIHQNFPFQNYREFQAI